MTSAEINSLIEEHGAVLYRFCRRITQTQEDADDLYQDTMLRAIEKSDKIEGARNPRSYLAGIAVKLWAYQKRRKSRRERIAPTQEINEEIMQDAAGLSQKTPETVCLLQERDKLVRYAVEQLPDHLRMPICLYYTAELSVQEIAEATGVPAGTVKSRLYKARQAIKAVMEENDYDKS